MDAWEGAAPDGLGGQLREPALHEVEPGRGCRNEVEEEPLLALDPPSDDRMFVSIVVVQHQVE